MKRPNSKIVAIIPARGGSKRLPRKNIYPIWGYPMIAWAIAACQEARHITDVFVSTEDVEIANISEKFGASIIQRSPFLADDNTFKQEVIINAIDVLKEPYDLVVSLQANSPQIHPNDLDQAIEKLRKFDRSEIFSVDQNLIQNGAFRIMKYDYVYQRSISTYAGVFVTDYVDVHTIDDVAFLEDRFPGHPYLNKIVTDSHPPDQVNS